MAAIRTATWSDWQTFTAWAVAEGWRVPVYERELFLEQGLGRASVLLVDERPAGFITTLRHGSSAWIGNLMIAPDRRRQGLGRRLFSRACERLRLGGSRTLWLTASDQGVGLYARHGFIRTGTIRRWIGYGTGAPETSAPAADSAGLLQYDRIAWGDDRSKLLKRLAARGEVITRGWSVALLQDAGGYRIAGPWLTRSADPEELRALLSELLRQTPAGRELVIDTLGHSPLNDLLTVDGFHNSGQCALMALGPTDAVQFDQLVALASLGSLG